MQNSDFAEVKGTFFVCFISRGSHVFHFFFSFFFFFFGDNEIQFCTAQLLSAHKA